MLDPSPIIRLVIVDDHQGLRQILADALAEVPGFKVVGQASTGRETLELCQEVAPDIVLLDAMLPDANGLDLVRSLRRSSPRTRVVIYTGNTSPILVSRAVELGVSGFVEKSAAFPDLLKAIRSVASGTCYFSKAANQTMMRLRRSPFPPGACDRLTPRERMVLSAIAAGRRSKEIAADLGLSLFTVNNHRQRIKGKTGLSSTSDLTLHALHLGLIQDQGPPHPVETNLDVLPEGGLRQTLSRR